MENWPLLSLLVWLPIVGSIPVLLSGAHRPQRARWLGLLVALASLALAMVLCARIDPQLAAPQLVERHEWIGAIGALYYLGADGLSVALIVLTSAVTILTLIGAWESIEDRAHQYVASFLILEGLMVGVFCAQDALLFYVFFEAMLIPMFIIIGIWGGPRRVYATIKFFLYTFFGSIFMLVALIYLHLKAGHTWELTSFAQLPLSSNEQAWLFFAFLLAFAVKVPMWPVHTWLPDAHVEAPTGGSVILAAIMLKIGGYGFLRFSLPITPDASHEFAWLLVALSLAAVVYIGFVALVQEDMKKLIAYSSIAHMGFATLGIFIAPILLRETGRTDAALLGLQGAMVQMLSHGFVSGAMFSCVGVLYDRMHTRRIGDYGGVANTMPWFAACFVLLSMANAGLPGTSGFVGEFMVILASFQVNAWVAAGAALTLVLGAAYTLWLVKRILFGEVANPAVAALKDISAREALVLVAFVLAVLFMGLWPAPWIRLMDAPLAQLLQQVAASKL